MCKLLWHVEGGMSACRKDGLKLINFEINFENI